MPIYKSQIRTPDVYVQEVSVFPPSVAEVETAVPAFIGYTAKASVGGTDVFNKPIRITSLPEFELYFGAGPEPHVVTVKLDGNNGVQGVEIGPKYFLYDSLRMFYGNGGGKCYIVSVGMYKEDGTVDFTELKTGLDALQKEDEPTILLSPDSVMLSADNLATLQNAMLDQCGKLGDRVALLDIKDGTLAKAGTTDPVGVFRDKLGIASLKYGAAYYPWLDTVLTVNPTYANIKGTILKAGSPVAFSTISTKPELVNGLEQVLNDEHLLDSFIKDEKVDTGYDLIDSSGDKDEMIARAAFIQKVIDGYLSLSGSFLHADVIAAYGLTKTATTGPIASALKKLVAYDKGFPKIGTTGVAVLGVITGSESKYSGLTLGTIAADAAIYGTAPATELAAVVAARPAFSALLEKVRGIIAGVRAIVVDKALRLEDQLVATDPIYNNIKKAAAGAGITLPPSGAIAGIYAKVDNERGVWKAPANVSLNYVKAPSVKVTFEDQEELNIDATSGKSVNAIRTFAGKGTLVWGARTLAGNDNEWRYVPVRRFFNMVEESIMKSTYWAVFEPNDANLWMKVKAMIENYLVLKWREGALQGAKPADAFFVNTGLGLTMTAIDILEGRLIVEIGMAVVRPAEFIILRFMHKMVRS